MSIIKYYLIRPCHINNYEINTNCQKFAQSLKLQFGTYLKESMSESSYEINIWKNSNETYSFESAMGEWVTDRPLNSLEDILFNTTTFSENIIALHGAAIEYNGYSYVFLAPTTTGKTTLTAYLTHLRFGYITEDCVLVDKNNLVIYPYTCPIHLRWGGIDVLNKYGINIENLEFLDDPVSSRYVYTPKNSVQNSTPLKKIFFISRHKKENKIISMTASESVRALLQSSITVPQLTSDYIKSITDISKTGCSKLKYSDMEYVAKVIKEEDCNG